MSDKFQIWSRSANKEPGKGVGEYVKYISTYRELRKIKNWRKMLTNFYLSPFELDDNIWISVEHYCEASKFRDFDNETNYNFYKTFTINGGKSWSTDVFKNIKVPNNVSVRQDFTKEGTLKKAMVIALFSKFTQNDELKNVLLNTKDAELWQFNGRGYNPDYLYHLMVVRDCIRKYNGIEELKKISKFSRNDVSKILSSKYGLVLDRSEYKYNRLYAQDKVLLNGEKGIIICRYHHPDSSVTYDIKIKDKIMSHVPCDKVFKLI